MAKERMPERAMVRMHTHEREAWRQARSAMAQRAGIPEIDEATFIRLAANDFAERIMKKKSGSKT
jgi:hypothetical protein